MQGELLPIKLEKKTLPAIDRARSMTIHNHSPRSFHSSDHEHVCEAVGLLFLI